MNQDPSQKFNDIKAEAQRQIEQAINMLERAANLLVQASRVYPDDIFLEERIIGIVEGEEDGEEIGIRGKMEELRMIKTTIASLLHVQVT